MDSFAFYIFIAFITGTIAGSFFNVLIWRIPIGQSIITPPSYCPSCKTPIRFYYNIPILGYIICNGKCRNCTNPISLMYPAIELFCGIMSLFLCLHFVNTTQNITTWIIATIVIQCLWLLLLIPMAIIDIKHFIIPDSFTLPFLIIGIAISFAPDGITPLQSILGILAGGGSLYLIGWTGTLLLKRDDVMGGGDIKLMAAAGALFGWESAIMSIMLGAFLGSLAGVMLLLTRKLKMNNKIPFGPFLGIGIWIAALWAEKILVWYLSFITA